MEVKTEELLRGALRIIQPDEKSGPRVNVDTILLANFTNPKAGERILEIGCAHGAVSLILAYRGYCVTGIDIQESLIDMARCNAKLNGLEKKLSFDVCDIKNYKSLWPAQMFDRIVVNPPYDEESRSRKSPFEAIATSMHGTMCTLSDILEASKYLLKNKGRLNMVIRASRTGELFAKLQKYNIAPKLVRSVHPRPSSPASVVLVEAARASGSGLIVGPPLFILDENGKETADLLLAYEVVGA